MTHDAAPGSSKAGDAELVRQFKSWDLVAFLGLLTFVTTLASESGRAAYWGFPFEFVQFTPENAFLTFVKLAVAGLFLSFVVQVARNWNWYRIAVSLLSVLLIAWTAWRLTRQWGGPSLVVAYAGLMYCIWATVVFFQEDRAKEGQWSNRFVRLFGRAGIGLTVLLILVPFLASALGYWLAADEEDFLVTSKEPQRVILATYGSSAVSAALNYTKEGAPWISSAFSVVELSSSDLGEIYKKKLGHLEVRRQGPVNPASQ